MKKTTKKEQNPKFMLKGISQDDGKPFKREIFSLNEVKEVGDYTFITQEITEFNGFPKNNSNNNKCLCCVHNRWV